MKQFQKKLQTLLENTLAILLALVFLIVILLVFLRYVFNESITGSNEFIVILFVYATSLGAALGVGKSDHLAVRFLVLKLPEVIQKKVVLIQDILVALINLVAFIYSIHWIKHTGDYLMPSTGLPRWVAQLSIPLGCFLSLLFCFFKFLPAARLAKPGKKEPS